MDQSEFFTASELSQQCPPLPLKHAILSTGPSHRMTTRGPPLACVEKALSNSLLDFSCVTSCQVLEF